MQIFPIIDPYAVHYSSFAGDVYTLDTAGITLTAGTLTASTLTDGTLSITGGDIINVDQIGIDLAAPKAQLEFGTTVPVISATHSLHQGYNCYYDGSWKRTVADNQACMLSFAADGAFHFYVQSDALATVDSVITWDNVMTLDNDGVLVFDILKVDNLTLNGAGIYSNGTIELIAAGAIYFRASDDNDDYISISTAANQTTLNFAGQDGIITSTGGHTTIDGIDVATDVAANTAHISASGASHTYIDQAVTAAAAPTFTGLTVGDTGGTTNYTNFSATGVQTMAGTARVTKTVTMDWYTATMGSGVELFIYGRDADKDAVEMTSWTIYIPNDFASGTDVVVKWRWAPTATNSDGVDRYVYWQGWHNAAGSSGTIGGATTIASFSTTVPDGEVLRTIHETTFDTISGLSAGDFLSVVCYRDADHASDDYNADVFVFLNAYIEYTADKLGTAL